MTRPRALAAGLATLIEQSGGRAVLFPAIEIEDLPPPAALRDLEAFDLAVFISPTAVQKVMERVAAGLGNAPRARAARRQRGHRT